eukprot:7282088-Prymnesium_polylepis.1
MNDCAGAVGVAQQGAPRSSTCECVCNATWTWQEPVGAPRWPYSCTARYTAFPVRCVGLAIM